MKINDKKPFEIVEYTQTETDLAELRTQLRGVVFDCTTNAGMREAKSSRMMFVKLRTGLERLRVEIKAPALERSRAIDSEAKRITADILVLEEPIQAEIKVEEDRAETERLEAERIENERIAEETRLAAETQAVWVQKITNIKARPLDFISAGSEEIKIAIGKAQAAIETAVPQFPEDLQLEARAAFKGAVEQMTTMFTGAVQREETAARLKELESAQPETANDDGISNEPSEAGPTPSPVVQSGSIRSGICDAPDTTAVSSGWVDKETGEVLNSEATESAAADNLIWTALITAAEGVIAHYGEFRKPHASIIALTEAVENVKAV